VDFDSAVNAAMRMLAQDSRTLFVGQSVAYDGATMYYSLDGVPQDKRLEMPVIEDFQLGFCIGLSLMGRIPICIYPRFDFLLLAMNQLVLHLDRFCEMGDFRPKVIVRVRVGPQAPLNAGPQHTGNYTRAFAMMLRNVKVVEVNTAQDVERCYRAALARPQSTLVVENKHG
jgi:pyruvate/2-oxoglutarate/acetoin dehydrogenase E1 component